VKAKLIGLKEVFFGLQRIEIGGIMFSPLFVLKEEEEVNMKF